MDSDTPHPLTIEQAKARLRAAADEASPGAWLHQHPWAALGIALASGYVVSRMRLPMAASTLLTQKLAPLLLGAAIRKVTDRAQRRP